MRSSIFVFALGLSLLVELSALPARAAAPALELDKSSGPSRVSIFGETGRFYLLQSSSNLADSAAWVNEVTLPLTNSFQAWIDAQSLSGASRFYRSMEFSNPPTPVFVKDFRLVDHLDRSQALYYQIAFQNHTNRAVVLIFTGNGCANIRELISTIKSLRDRFSSQGVVFWMIDANNSDTRSNIIAEATSQGIDLPILHDHAQIVARELGVRVTPEVVAINATTATVFYRGALDDRIGPTAGPTTQSYLEAALVNYLSNQTVSPAEVLPRGCEVEYRPLANISYATNIAPLLQAKCVRCHSPGNIAPWSMTNHAIVQTYAEAMRGEVLAGRMPPWHADPRYQTFTNDASLNVDQKAMLLQWLRDGAPRGNGPDPLAAMPAVTTNYPYAWPANLGQPSNIITIPIQTIPASGMEPYHYLTSSPMPSNMWVYAAVVKPGNTRVLHHCLVYPSGSFLQGLDGFFAGYVPGNEGAAFPTNTGKFLAAGSTLRFQLHYTTTGTSETDQTQLGLYTLPAPPQFQLLTKSAFNAFFSIPPGQRDHPVNAEFQLSASRRVRIYEMSPHMHYRGSRFRYDAVTSTGARQTLLSVPNYKFNWQRLYRFTTPVELPPGTKLECFGAFDNSPQNMDNPDPNATVMFGDMTSDEMFIGYFNYIELP